MKQLPEASMVACQEFLSTRSREYAERHRNPGLASHDRGPSSGIYRAGVDQIKLTLCTPSLCFVAR